MNMHPHRLTSLLVAIAAGWTPALGQEPVDTGPNRGARDSSAVEQERARDRAGEPAESRVAFIERAHRSRLARIQRLMEIYRERDDRSRIDVLERLRARQAENYRADLARLENEIGRDRFRRARAQVDRRELDRPTDVRPRSDRTLDRRALDRRHDAPGDRRPASIHRDRRPDVPRTQRPRGSRGRAPTRGGRQ